MWQPGRQTFVRRSVVQLQQVGEAGGQRHRRRHCQTQAQTFTAHRCCKLTRLIFDLIIMIQRENDIAFKSI